jgi:PKD repeat protein
MDSTRSRLGSFLRGQGAARGFAAGLITLAACAPGGSGGGGGDADGALAADFSATPASGEAPCEVRFTDRSSGGATSWSWDLGDGSSSSERNPTHLYLAPGAYTVSLSVNSPGESDSVTRANLVQVGAASANAIEFGMNPSFQRWSNREIVFADAMLRATAFVRVVNGIPGPDVAPLIPLGQSPPGLGEGWPDFGALAPGEEAGCYLFGSMERALPDGRTQPYVLTWEGTGDCRLAGQLVTGEKSRTARRVEVWIDPTVGNGNGTVAWILGWSSPQDPVRNVHVWLPGMEGSKPLFWPPYVELVQAMNRGAGPHTWRTLDWNHINDYGALGIPGAFVFDLAGRIRPGSPSQGTKRGICPEFQVAFVNRIGANLHFQLPHRTAALSEADYATYVRDVLTRIRDGAPALPGINGGQRFAGLAPGLTLTLELSNEIWNSGFPQYNWFRSQAQAHGVSVHEEIARQLVSVWAIADQVFSGSQAGRLRRYVGGFIADDGFVRRILEALPPGTRVDALGPACYFKPLNAVVDGWLVGASPSVCPNCPSPAQVIAAARDSIETLRGHIRDHARVAAAYTNPDGSHPSLELYEAGQSFIANYQPWGDAARAAQVHPDMYAAYVDGLIPMLVEEGVELVNWYSFMTDQDPTLGVSVGFGVWNDMSQTLTLPVREPYLHEGVPKAAAIYRGPPAR